MRTQWGNGNTMKHFTLIIFLLSFGCSTQPKNTVYYQAYDGKWDDPTINPIFEDEREAKEYAHRNNVGSLYSGDTSHSYIVKAVNYRYEIRHFNDSIDDAIYHSLDLADAKKYLNEYGLAHSDLFLYDLKTGELIETSTP